jgi:hypothetical protein
MEHVEIVTPSAGAVELEALPFEPRFHEVGEGLYRSADGRGHLRHHSPQRFSLRWRDSSLTGVLLAGLAAAGRVFLRRADGVLLEADVLSTPERRRMAWRRLRAVVADPSAPAPWDAVRVAYSPNTRNFRSTDGRLAGRFLAESGRLIAAEGERTFDGLVGAGAVALCFEDGAGGAFPVTAEPDGQFRIHGLRPYLAEDRIPV